MQIPAPTAVSKVANHGIQALRSAQGSSDAAAKVRNHLMETAWLSFATGFVAILLFRSIHCLKRSVSDQVTWKEDEDRLDAEIDSTMDASDPIAKY